MKPHHVLALLGLGWGCAEPRHLQYDFGRSYDAVFTAQTDLTRPDAQGLAYPLYGMEGVQIRLRVQEAATTKQTSDIKN